MLLELHIKIQQIILVRKNLFEKENKDNGLSVLPQNIRQSIFALSVGTTPELFYILYSSKNVLNEVFPNKFNQSYGNSTLLKAHPDAVKSPEKAHYPEIKVESSPREFSISKKKPFIIKPAEEASLVNNREPRRPTKPLPAENQSLSPSTHQERAVSRQRTKTF